MDEKLININVHDPFYKAVKAVFDNWTAYQLAISHNFAGAQTQEAAEWFLKSTYQWIVDNPDLELYELEEFLADTMNQEFNTILDDASESQVAALLLNYAGLSRAGRHAELTDEVAKKFASAATSKKTTEASVKLKQDGDDDEDDQDDDNDESSNEEDENEPMDDEAANVRNKSELTKEDEENFDKMDDGWTLVTKSGKHLTK